MLNLSEALRQSPSKLDLLVVDGYSLKCALEHAHMNPFCGYRCDEHRLSRLLLEIFVKLTEEFLPDGVPTARPQSSWSFVANVIWIRGMFLTSVSPDVAAAWRRCKPLDDKKYSNRVGSPEQLLNRSIRYLEAHG